jgi:primosomal protein N'
MSSPRSQVAKGTSARTTVSTDHREFLCVVCGHTVMGIEPPSRCPMCNQSAWNGSAPGIAGRLARVLRRRHPHEYDHD